MCFFFKYRPWLIKSDMAVPSKAQKLQIQSAQRTDDCLMFFTCLFFIRIAAVRNINCILTYIYIPEQVLLHKIVIALPVPRVQTAVFIQIDRGNPGKIQRS